MIETRLLRLIDIIGDRKRGIAGIIPMSEPAWYRGMAKGNYPKPIKISERSVAWRGSDIDKLLARLCGSHEERVEIAQPYIKHRHEGPGKTGEVA